MLAPPTQFSMAPLVEDALPHPPAQEVLLGRGPPSRSCLNLGKGV